MKCYIRSEKEEMEVRFQFIKIIWGLDDRGYKTRFQSGSGAHPASYWMGTRGFFPEGKEVGREADHSPLSNANVKNARSYTSTSPVSLHGVVLS